MERPQNRGRVGSPAIDIVSRHQRNGPDPKLPGPDCGDLQSRVGGGCARCELKGNVAPLGAGGRHAEDLAIGRADAPNERNLNRGAGIAAQQEVSLIKPALCNVDATLAKSARQRCIDRDACTLHPDVGIVVVHPYYLIASYWPPFSIGDPGAALDALRRRRVLPLRDDGVIELSVIEHFGPQAPRNQLAYGLDEHPVFIGGHRNAGLARID